jgi:hypothetical protein
LLQNFRLRRRPEKKTGEDKCSRPQSKHRAGAQGKPAINT